MILYFHRWTCNLASSLLLSRYKPINADCYMSFTIVPSMLFYHIIFSEMGSCSLSWMMLLLLCRRPAFSQPHQISQHIHPNPITDSLADPCMTSDLTCRSRCGEAPMTSTDCGCDKHCHIYGDCCHDVRTWCSRKYPLLAH